MSSNTASTTDERATIELVIRSESDGERRVRPDNGRSVIGKGNQTDIRIKDPLLSRRHCELIISETGLMVHDLGSTNGTWVDDQAIAKGVTLEPGQHLRLGRETYLYIETPRSENAVAEANPGATEAESPAPEPSADQHQQLKQEIQRRILEYLDMRRRGSLDQMSAEEIRSEARSAAEMLIDQGEIQVPAAIDRDALLKAVVAEAIGLGPIEPLMEDESVSEVMVNGPHQIFVERKGRIERSEQRFSSDAALMNVIDRIVTPVGRRIDEGNPLVDARLSDGSRVNVIIPPLSLSGPAITIRKFSRERLRGEDLVGFGSMSADMADFLRLCVEYRRNIVVSGGTGSGKTTTLNVLSDYIPESERIVTIEDSAELQLSQEHTVSLESRPPNMEGSGEVSIRDLVRNSLRMRPDRIVVGECRGGEALDMLQAMNTGHDGSLTTGHANSPRDMLSRLEVMVMMSGMELPSRAIREQIAAAVDVIVQISRLSDGRRIVTDVEEVGNLEGDIISLQKIFTYRRTGLDESGQVTGYHTGLGYAPGFYGELRDAGVHLDWDIFRNADEGAEGLTL